MNNIANIPEGIFRLLVPATDLTPSEVPFVKLCGSCWVLAEFARISDAPPYTCISYSWGRGRTMNMLNDGLMMSDRTLPAIEATIKASQPPENWTYALMCGIRDAQKEAKALAAALKASQAYWIDALCVPPQGPAQTKCLRSMGAIYNSAWQVFVVLSEPCSSVFHQIRDTGRLDPTALFILERDDWITRAWAYQEAVNSQRLYFIAQDDECILVSGLDFLNAVTTATSDDMHDHGIDSFAWGEQHPRLDSFEILIADYRIAEYVARSAYQVMSAIYQRAVERSEDHFYGMIGAITTQLLDSQDNQLLHPSEYFMRVCEAKGDYSFIYCIAPRSDEPGRCWRPIAGKIPPVLSGVLVAGSGQAGSLRPSHLQLENMCRLVPSVINSDGLKATRVFLHGDCASLSPDDIAAAILVRLRQKGFSGCGDYVELENGFFFPQSTFTRSDDIFVVISPDVHWTTGWAGLLVRSNGSDINHFCDVGVFVGRLPKAGESINVG